MQANFYNELADNYNKLIFVGRIISLAGGQIKLSNKNYTSIPHDFCLAFDKSVDLR